MCLECVSKWTVKIITEKGYNVTLDPTIKTSYGQAVAGKITTKDNSKYSKYEYYLTNFKIENMFQCKVNIGIDPNENKHLYEVNKIKKPVVYQKQVWIGQLAFLQIMYHNQT